MYLFPPNTRKNNAHNGTYRYSINIKQPPVVNTRQNDFTKEELRKLQEIEKISSLIPDKNTPVFLHCRSGKRSGKAAKILASMGYTKAVNIGGIKDYR